MIHKQPSPINGHIRVTFELPASIWADHIYLVGDFNDWHSHATPLYSTRNGIWRVTLDLPVGQRYEFRYLIDDHWCSDQHADGYVMGACQAMNSYVDTRLPLETHANDTGYSMVHDSSPQPAAKPPTTQTNSSHWHPRTPANGRGRKHAAMAS